MQNYFRLLAHICGRSFLPGPLGHSRAVRTGQDADMVVVSRVKKKRKEKSMTFLEYVKWMTQFCVQD